MLASIALVNQQWIFMPGLGHLSFWGCRFVESPWVYSPFINPCFDRGLALCGARTALAVYRHTGTGRGHAPGETN